MFNHWLEHTVHVKKSFGELGKKHPKMLQAYLALDQAAAAWALPVVATHATQSAPPQVAALPAAAKPKFRAGGL